MRETLLRPYDVKQSPRSGWLERLCRQGLWRCLNGLQEGVIRLQDPFGEQCFGQLTPACQLTVRLQVHDMRFYSLVALRNSTVGPGEAFMAGYWSCDNLTDLIRITVINRDVMNAMDGGLARLMLPLLRLYHLGRRNTLHGSRANIAAHYDLGNDFYKLFLDETLMYSSAVFPHPDASLLEASQAKIERICQKLDLRPEDHLLEIGTGWGALAIHAARHYGCRVTTTTISAEQYQLARERVREAGLEDRVQVLQQDYRELQGSFDKLVSVEMIEAVGYRYFETYFRGCSRLLKPDGLMLLQSITIADQHYAAAKRYVDFIQRYIFPGGFLPSVTAITDSLTRGTDMRLFHLEDFGPHYALTLRQWRDRFVANLDKVRTLGFSESFIRMWLFYLHYCEGGFLERNIGVVQLLLIKPRCRRAPLLPTLG